MNARLAKQLKTRKTIAHQSSVAAVSCSRKDPLAQHHLPPLMDKPMALLRSQQGSLVHSREMHLLI